MNPDALLDELRRMLREYISDLSIREELEKDVERTKVKYVLGELERYRDRELSAQDEEIVKDLVFYFV
jgi:hypothetical protein